MKSPYTETSMSEGIAAADAGANPAWKDLAYKTLVHLAQSYPTVMSDDVLDMLETDTTQTPDLRALGPVFLRARQNGIITITDETRPSRYGVRRWKRPVWRSLVLGCSHV